MGVGGGEKGGGGGRAGKRSIPVGTLVWNIPMISGLRIGAEGCCGFVEGKVWV